jgi:hypothetical protein
MAANEDRELTPDRGGKGSVYGGTQSPDPDKPDGYQKPQAGKDAGNTDQRKDTELGEEYDDNSSYGRPEGDPGTAAGEKGDTAGTDARGSGIR